jgi:hypothetical protein
MKSFVLLVGCLLVSSVIVSVAQEQATPAPAAPGENGKVRTFYYHSIHVESGDVIGESVRRMEHLSSGQISVKAEWSSVPDSASGTGEAILDRDFTTRSWVMSNPGNDTEIRGERNGESLSITGTLRGEPVSKEIEIDEMPFYHNPSLGLEAFVRSGEKKREFRTLRPDNLEQYKMKAEVKETDMITVNGAEVEAVKVKWGLTGLRSMFFSRELWYRKSDGVFLKSQENDGAYRELYREE